MLQVKKFGGTYKEILPLADVYMRSYNKLSREYKTSAEMALYNKGSFIRKLKNWANNQAKGNEPFIFVLYNNEQPCGIMRLNKIDEYYRNIDSNLSAQTRERDNLDGWVIDRKRKIQYSRNPQFDNNTLILNQLYLAPEAQKQGLGTYFIKTVIPELQKQGFEQFIVEYNDNNANGKKFHEDVLCVEKIATTSDFDHVTSDNGKADFCISPVSIGISKFSNVLKNIAIKEKSYSRVYGNSRC